MNRSGRKAVETLGWDKKSVAIPPPNGPYCGALSLYRSVFFYVDFHRNRGGRADEKTLDYACRGGTCARIHGALGERAKPAAGGGEPAFAGAERNADPSGGVPRIWPPLPAGIPLGLRAGAVLVRALLAPVDLVAGVDDARPSHRKATPQGSAPDSDYTAVTEPEPPGSPFALNHGGLDE